MGGIWFDVNVTLRRVLFNYQKAPTQPISILQGGKVLGVFWLPGILIMMR